MRVQIGAHSSAATMVRYISCPDRHERELNRTYMSEHTPYHTANVLGSEVKQRITKDRICSCWDPVQGLILFARRSPLQRLRTSTSCPSALATVTQRLCILPALPQRLLFISAYNNGLPPALPSALLQPVGSTQCYWCDPCQRRQRRVLHACMP